MATAATAAVAALAPAGARAAPRLPRLPPQPLRSTAGHFYQVTSQLLQSGSSSGAADFGDQLPAGVLEERRAVRGGETKTVAAAAPGGDPLVVRRRVRERLARARKQGSALRRPMGDLASVAAAAARRGRLAAAGVRGRSSRDDKSRQASRSGGEAEEQPEGFYERHDSLGRVVVAAAARGSMDNSTGGGGGGGGGEGGATSDEQLARRRSTVLLVVPEGGASGSSPALRPRHRSSVYQDAQMIARFKRKSKRPDLVRKFKAAAWISILIRRLCIAHMRNSEDHDSPYMKDVKFVEVDDRPKLLFDVAKFKANREIRMSEDCKKILCLPRWARTESELLHVQISLRTISDYAAYPITTQRHIAEVGQYLKYEPRRIIVREGHPAWNFYFIVSGSVLVIVLDEDRKYVIPKAVLRRGQSFGELALLSGKPRMSTVIAMEDVEMVCIWHEDYKRIFNNGGVKKSEDEFLKGLPFLTGWPLDVADDHPQQFRYHFYKQGEIVVKDSSNSVWIIIVKSGSLNVIKKLRHAEPFVSRTRRPNASRAPVRKWQRRLKPLMATKDHWSMSRQARDGLESKSQLDNAANELTPGGGVNIASALPDVTYDTDARNIDSTDNEGIAAAITPTSEVPEVSEEEVLKRARKEAEELRNNADAAKMVKQELKTAAQILDQGYQVRDERVTTEADLHPMFVHVRTLTKGHVFGVNEVIFGDQPSFSVISNGAECILIDKTLYLKYLTEDLQKTLRVESQLYPGDAEMQNNLQISVDWEAYKTIVISKAIQLNRQLKMLNAFTSVHRQ